MAAAVLNVAGSGKEVGDGVVGFDGVVGSDETDGAGVVGPEGAVDAGWLNPGGRVPGALGPSVADCVAELVAGGAAVDCPRTVRCGAGAASRSPAPVHPAQASAVSTATLPRTPCTPRMHPESPKAT